MNLQETSQAGRLLPRAALAAVLLALVLAGVWLAWRARAPAAAGAAPDALGTPVGAAVGDEPRAWFGRVREPDGGRPDLAQMFQLDAQGHLVIDADTSVALEMLVSELPESPSAQDVQRLEDTVRKALPAGESDHALRLLRSYRAYVSEAEQQLAPAGIPQSLDDVNALFEQMAAVRLKHFDRATADALFGAHEAYARYSMQTTFIEQDPHLSGPVKQQRLDDLRAALPPQVQAMIAPLSPEQEALEREVARQRRAGANDAQIEALRQHGLAPAR